MDTQIFKDLLVVELAAVLAGPAVGMFFAELGARVIKIENKRTGGDVTRRWKLPSEDPESPFSAYYHSVNWGKETLLLDLTDAEDNARVLALIGKADIVISNFRLTSAKKMGLDYGSLQVQFPQLIYGQITAYGEDSDRPAFDMVLQAEAGFMYMTGDAAGDPARMPVALVDLLAAHQLKEGLLVALLRRGGSGRGAYVTVSLRDAAIASLANQASNWLVAGYIPQRMGSRHPNIAPYGDIFTTGDGRPLVLAVGSDGQFAALCRSLQLSPLEQDPRFSSNELRVRNRDVLVGALSKAVGGLGMDALETAFRRDGVPFGRIRNMQEVFDDPAVSRLILEDEPEPGRIGRRVRTAVFQLR